MWDSTNLTVMCGRLLKTTHIRIYRFSSRIRQPACTHAFPLSTIILLKSLLHKCSSNWFKKESMKLRVSPGLHIQRSTFFYLSSSELWLGWSYPSCRRAGGGVHPLHTERQPFRLASKHATSLESPLNLPDMFVGGSQSTRENSHGAVVWWLAQLHHSKKDRGSSPLDSWGLYFAVFFTCVTFRSRNCFNFFKKQI